MKLVKALFIISFIEVIIHSIIRYIKDDWHSEKIWHAICWGIVSVICIIIILIIKRRNRSSENPSKSSILNK